jgi:hypothetical protein
LVFFCSVDERLANGVAGIISYVALQQSGTPSGLDQLWEQTRAAVNRPPVSVRLVDP